MMALLGCGAVVILLTCKKQVLHVIRHYGACIASAGAWTYLVILRDTTEKSSSFVGSIDPSPPLIVQFANAVTFGQRHSISFELEEAFVVLGIMHLLVVSGLHLTLYSGLIFGVISAPLRLAYSLRLLSPMRTFEWLLILRVLFCFFVFASAVSLGLPVSAKRAMLFVVVHQLAGTLGALVPANVVLIAFFLQSLLLPVEFATKGNMLSWLAYLLVYDFSVSKKGKLLSLCKLQCALMALTTAVFGSLSWLALVANLLIVPIFPLIFVTSLIFVMLRHVGTEDIVLINLVLEGFLWLCLEVAILAKNMGLYDESLNPAIRVIAGMVLLISLVNVLRNLSMTKENQLDQR